MSKKKPTLAERINEEHLKAQEEFDKLPPEEQKKIRKGAASLRRKWRNQPWY